jgi:hypothetical protein
MKKNLKITTSGLDVMYKFKFNEMLAANASAYLIVGAFQVGCRIGMEASF